MLNFWWWQKKFHFDISKPQIWNVTIQPKYVWRTRFSSFPLYFTIFLFSRMIIAFVIMDMEWMRKESIEQLRNLMSSYHIKMLCTVEIEKRIKYKYNRMHGFLNCLTFQANWMRIIVFQFILIFHMITWLLMPIYIVHVVVHVLKHVRSI